MSCQATSIMSWAKKYGVFIVFDVSPEDRVLRIPTLEGTHEAKPGDWIIKGIKDEFYPCKPDIFEKTYESVE